MTTEIIHDEERPTPEDPPEGRGGDEVPGEVNGTRYVESGGAASWPPDHPPAERRDDRNQWAALPDGKRSRLRDLMRRLDGAVARLRPAMDAASTGEIDRALRALAVALDLGAEPLVAACPRCGRLGMADATVCGHCWRSLPPQLVSPPLS